MKRNPHYFIFFVFLMMFIWTVAVIHIEVDRQFYNRTLLQLMAYALLFACFLASIGTAFYLLVIRNSAEKKVVPPTTDIFDSMAALEKTRGNKTIAEEMVALLVGTLPDDMENLLKSFQNEDFEAMQGVTHRIIGALQFSAAPALQKATEELHGCLVSRQYDLVPERTLSLTQEVDNFLNWLTINQAPFDA